MGQNLTGQTIASTYEDLVQISGSSRNLLTDGTGSNITNLQVTASFATTASFALNVTPINTGSFMVTGSAFSNILQFTKADGTSFQLTVATGSAVTVNTGSLLVTASISNATTTYTKGDGSTFALTVNNVQNANSASFASTASFTPNALVTASVSSNTITFSKGDGSTFPITVNTGSGGGSAFPFTGSANISGSLNLNGNALITGSLVIEQNADITAFNLTQFGQSAYAISQGGGYDTTVTIPINATHNFTGGGNNIYRFDVPTRVHNTFTVSGSSTFLQSTVLSGSIRGEVNALSIASNTASLNCALDNFFTLQLVSGSNTFINPSNILPGQTINLRINTTGSATVSFPSSVLQASGSTYVPTTTTGVDVVTFISFDSTSLLLSNIKNFI